MTDLPEPEWTREDQDARTNRLRPLADHLRIGHDVDPDQRRYRDTWLHIALLAEEWSVGAAIDSATVAISTMLDATYPDDLDPEAHRWRRCAKVSEEAGEVIEALLGVEAENPRKGRTHDLDDLRAELLDVALAAMGAWTHLNGNETGVTAALAEHVTGRAARLARAVAAPPAATP